VLAIIAVMVYLLRPGCAVFYGRWLWFVVMLIAPLAVIVNPLATNEREEK